MTQTAGTFDYDAFISYSHADQAWVRGWLAPTLRGAGLKVCVDYDSFPIGAPIVTAIEHAVVASRKTLMVLTPSYLKSEWTTFENLLAQYLDPAAQRARLIPIMRRKCELPPRVGYLIWADLRKENPDELAKVIAAIRSEPLPVTPAQPVAAAKPAAPRTDPQAGAGADPPFQQADRSGRRLRHAGPLHRPIRGQRHRDPQLREPADGRGPGRPALVHRELPDVAGGAGLRPRAGGSRPGCR